MYYRLKYGKYYLFKIGALVLSAVLGELFIWWALVRDESVDWIAGQLVHNPSVYAITQMEDGRTIVGNVLYGFEITLPEGWEVEGGRMPNFFLINDGYLICKINTQIDKEPRSASVGELLKEQDKQGFTRISAGITSAIKGEGITKNGDFFYELDIPVDSIVVEYLMTSGSEDKLRCRPYFEQVRKSFLYY